MSERDPDYSSEFSQVTEYTVAHHDKGEHTVYKIVPRILIGMLDDLPSFEGFAIGGSYASGRYRDGDDVDLDIFFDEYPDLPDRQLLLTELDRRFSVNGLTAEVRAPLAKAAIPESMRRNLYDPYPNTPFVVRKDEVAKDWGLLSDSNIEQ